MVNEINLVCQINHTSYGLCATNLLKSLDRLGIKINLFSVISDNHIEALPEDHEVIRKALYNAQDYDLHTPSIRLWHQFGLDKYPGFGKKYGWPIFELDRFNDREMRHLQAQQYIIVCSKWALNILRENGIKCPVYIVPLGVDTSIFSPIKLDKADNITRFYNIGKWEVRKGHDIIKDCFEKAFRPEDNVELHMFCANRLLSEKQSKEWENFYSNSKIKVYNWLPSQKELSSYISKMDCGLFISRAEGWDLGLLESMAMGKEVIVTNCTGHLEYVNNDNAMLVNVDKTEPAYDGVWFTGQGNWAQIGKDQEEQIINYMREIHRKKQAGDNLFNKAGVFTAKQFTWDASVKKLLEILY